MTQTIWQQKPQAHADHGRRPRRARHRRARTSCSRSSRISAPTARPAARSNSPARRSARCRSKAGSRSATCRSRPARAAAWSRRTRRRSPISRAGPMRRRARSSTAPSRNGRRWRPTADAAFDREVTSMPRASRRSSPGAPAPRTRCRSTPACPIRRASRTRTAPSICARRSTTWASRRASKLTDIAVDRVFIGSCTNSRIEDLRAAAAVLAGRTSKVPGLVSAGSSLIKRQAEEEGLDRIFRDAGLEWGESGCSMCVGINGDLVAPGRALRLDHQPQFPRPAGAGRAHASDVAGDGGGCGGHRPSRRRAAAARRPKGLSTWTSSRKLTATACPINQANLNTDQILPARYLKWTRAHGHRQGAVSGLALRRRGQGEAGLSDQQAGMAQRQDRRRRAAISAAAPRARPRSMRSTTTACAA